MTKEGALKILDKDMEYYQVAKDGETCCLDGWFTSLELQAIAYMMDLKKEKYERTQSTTMS